MEKVTNFTAPEKSSLPYFSEYGCVQAVSFTRPTSLLLSFSDIRVHSRFFFRNTGVLPLFYQEKRD
jgi:hypothetical protein